VVEAGARDGVGSGRRLAIRAQWLSGSGANPWQALRDMPAMRGILSVRQNPDGIWQLSVAQENQSLLIGFTLMGVLGFVAIV